MTEKGYGTNWKSEGHGVSADDLGYQPMTAQEVAQLDSYAGLILKTLQENSQGAMGYDEASVKRLSNDINGMRATLDEDGRLKIGNLYGAFLGKALIAANPGCGGRWVRIKNGDVAILFDRTRNNMTFFAMPITRVFNHLNQGEEHSIHSYFLAIGDNLRGQNTPGQPAAATAPSAAGKGGASAPTSSVQIGQGAGALTLFLPQGQCCNCGRPEGLSQFESTMQHQSRVNGRQLAFSLDLPYCPPCALTVGRFPPGIGRFAFNMVVVYGFLILFVYAPLASLAFFAKYDAALLILITLITIGVFYWNHTPTRPMTSVFQPVRLLDFSGDERDITYIAFKFTNKGYAAAFARLNRKVISKKALEIR